ncbi:MAG: ribosomal-processing cysteine protease Prp [Clostridia bacterium]
MTTIKIHKKDSKIIGITACGHADFDEEGLDIVCSAITSAVMMVHTYLDDVLKLNFETIVDESIALIDIKMNPKNKEMVEQAQPIFTAFYLHMQNLLTDYSENIEITEE